MRYINYSGNKHFHLEFKMEKTLPVSSFRHKIVYDSFNLSPQVKRNKRKEWISIHIADLLFVPKCSGVIKSFSFNHRDGNILMLLEDICQTTDVLMRPLFGFFLGFNVVMS